MEVGNILKIIETVKHNKSVKKKITIGEIVAIDSKITICRIKDGEKTWNISYSLGDLKDKTKKFYLQDAEGWKQISVKVRESAYNAL